MQVEMIATNRLKRYAGQPLNAGDRFMTKNGKDARLLLSLKKAALPEQKVAKKRGRPPKAKPQTYQTRVMTASDAAETTVSAMAAKKAAEPEISADEEGSA